MTTPEELVKALEESAEMLDSIYGQKVTWESKNIQGHLRQAAALIKSLTAPASDAEIEEIEKSAAQNYLFAEGGEMLGSFSFAGDQAAEDVKTLLRERRALSARIETLTAELAYLDAHTVDLGTYDMARDKALEDAAKWHDGQAALHWEGCEHSKSEGSTGEAAAHYAVAHEVSAAHFRALKGAA